MNNFDGNVVAFRQDRAFIFLFIDQVLVLSWWVHTYHTDFKVESSSSLILSKEVGVFPKLFLNISSNLLAIAVWGVCQRVISKEYWTFGETLVKDFDKNINATLRSIQYILSTATVDSYC